MARVSRKELRLDDLLPYLMNRLVARLNQNLAEDLRRRGFTFQEVAPDDRIERAVTFFALLELHSCGEAVLRQTRHLGDIHVSRPAPAPAGAAG